MRTRALLHVLTAFIGAFGFARFAAAADVPISFLPPPLEGTISLGIYDPNGKLVRVLHREAEFAEFATGPDGLRTKWDGKNDAGEPMPPGKYNVHGFVVGDLKVEDAPHPANMTTPLPKLVVKLMANPLTPSKKAVIELSSGYDEDGSFLETSDALPLFTVDEEPGIINTFVVQRPDKSLDFCQNDGDTTDCFHITRVEQMMAFDAGDFELK